MDLKKSPKTKYVLLYTYKTRLRQNFKNVLFFCPICHEEVEPVSYENHCDANHGTDSKTQCVWCGGNVSWQKGKKYENMDHVYRCAKSLLMLSKEEEEAISFTVFDGTPQFEKRNWFGHELPDDIRVCGAKSVSKFLSFPEEHVLSFTDESFYHPLARKVKDKNRLLFQYPEINTAVYCIRYFLDTNRKEYSFRHVMIRFEAYFNLLYLLDKYDRGETKALPFYCWCDGGHFREPNFRQHIHLILVSHKDHFMKNVWPHIKPKKKPCRNYSCKTSKVIETPSHLSNTMHYLCHPKSRCQFGQSPSGVPSDKHFHYGITEPKDFKYIVAAQWPNGLTTLIEEKIQNYVPEYDKVGLFKDCIDGKWKILIGEIPDLIPDFVFPVEPNCLPVIDKGNSTTTTTITRDFLYLPGKRKMYFERHADDVVFTAAQQASRGNVFPHNSKDVPITLRPKQQAALNRIERSVHRAVQKERAERDKEVSELKKERDEEVNRLRKIIEDRDAEILKMKNEEISHLKMTVRKLEEHVEMKNEEIFSLKKTVHKLEGIVEARDAELNRWKKNEMDRLRSEIVHLRKRLGIVRNDDDDDDCCQTTNTIRGTLRRLSPSSASPSAASSSWGGDLKRFRPNDDDDDNPPPLLPLLDSDGTRLDSDPIF